MTYSTPVRLDQLFAERLAADPDAPALVVGDRTWTRRDVADRAGSAARALHGWGVRPGDTVLTQYATDVEDLAVAVAAAALGATLVPVPTSMGGHELGQILELTRPRVALAHDAGLPAATTVPGGVRVERRADVVSGPTGPLPREPWAPGATAVIGCTAGSTGTPKGVMHGWDSLAYAAAQAADLVRLREGEAICTPGASAGAPGYAFFTYLGLTRGCPIVRAPKWDPDVLLDLMETHRCVWSMTVTTMLHMFIEAARARARRPDLSALRAVCVGGAAIKPELIRGAREVLGVEALRMFGLSECLGHAAMRPTDPESDRDTLDGYPWPGTDLRAFDDDGRPVGPGEVGEAGVRGPSLMQGYLGDESPESRLAPGGYFLTGDRIRIRPDGFVQVVGRKKDMIIRGGYNIDPVELEQLIRAYPPVLDVAVIGLPDERLGETTCAVVVPRPGQVVTLDEVRDHLRQHGLSTQKLPQHLALREVFPLSPDGKVLKQVLRKELAG